MYPKRPVGAQIRYFSKGKEVSWKEMERVLDRRSAALKWGGNGWVLVDILGIDILYRITSFLP